MVPPHRLPHETFCFIWTFNQNREGPRTIGSTLCPLKPARVQTEQNKQAGAPQQHQEMDVNSPASSLNTTRFSFKSFLYRGTSKACKLHFQSIYVFEPRRARQKHTRPTRTHETRLQRITRVSQRSQQLE